MTDDFNGRELYFGVLLDAIVNPFQRNIVDALTRAGAGERALKLQMPLLSERVWSALHGATA